MIIFFTASWCHYCKIMEPIVSQLQEEGYDITISKEYKEYGITKFPTLWVDGKKYPGVRTKKQYREYMNNDS